MLKYALKRLALMLLTFMVIMTICYVMVKLLPQPDPVTFGKDANLVLRRREMLGYGKPILEQYGIFLSRIAKHWDWGIGETLKTGHEVAAIFAEKLPSTLLVNLYSFFFSVPLGILFGIFAALRKNSWSDHFISTTVMIFVSVPSYVYAFLVQYFLCFKLGWFPFLMKPGTDYFSWKMFVSVVPAVLSLSFGFIAGLTRFTRAELTEVLTNDYMLLARTKGLTKSQATRRHALRNAMVPILPSIIGSFIGILSGSLIIEKIFGVPGVGNL
ncbi:MAG: ABC transporter permease [Eubacteriales bacterium]|nr:ABC transporter permease [Eubacteriales bacterium]